MKEIKIRVADGIIISIYIDSWQENAMEKMKKDLQNLTWKLFHRVEIVSVQE